MVIPSLGLIMAMNKFKNAFNKKWHMLSECLEVSGPLLSILYDHEVLTYRHFKKLKLIEDEFERVDKLLEILVRRDDSLFDVFCDDLEAEGQSNIVKIIRPEARPTPAIADESQHFTRQLSVCVPQERLVQTGSSKRDEQTTELKEILEVDYGLPNVLYTQDLITLPECQNIAQHCLDHRCKVQQRVSRLLKFVVKKLNKENTNLLNALRDTSFLRTLKETDQRHVVNFIKKDGLIDSISNDVRPLNRHQRRCLHPHLKITERSLLNSRDLYLQDMLLGEGVISVSQREYISADVPRTTSNERLLSIMMRRSVADVKAFFRCLVIMGCGDVVRRLNESGICVRVRTTINSRTMTDRYKHQRERFFVKGYNGLEKRSPWSKQYREVKESRTRLEKKRRVLKCVEANESIAWFIHCQTLDALDDLRDMYNSNELAHVLHDIFNSMRGGHEPLPLRVEWRLEDYEFCRTVLEKPSCQPFGALSYNDGLLLEALIFTLDAVPLGVLEMIIIRTSQLLYNVQRVSVHLSGDVKKHDVMLYSAEVATYRTLSSVCYRWWKLVSVSDWKLKKLFAASRVDYQMKSELPVDPAHIKKDEFLQKVKIQEESYQLKPELPDDPAYIKKYELLQKCDQQVEKSYQMMSELPVDPAQIKKELLQDDYLQMEKEKELLQEDYLQMEKEKELLQDDYLQMEKEKELLQDDYLQMEKSHQMEWVLPVDPAYVKKDHLQAIDLRVKKKAEETYLLPVKRFKSQTDDSCEKATELASTSSQGLIPQGTSASLTSVSHVISSDGRGAVAGVAIYSDKLFVLRERNDERIQQFDVKTFQEEKSIKVNGLRDGFGWYKSMASCDINSCLYINDSYKVYRVNPSTEDVISWPVDGIPSGLSVNETRNVLVTCYWDDTIKEYSTDGSFVRSIKLQVNHVKDPLHCIQLTDSRYVVCHESPVHGVSEIDKHGTLIATYRNSETTKLKINKQNKQKKKTNMDCPRCVILFNDSLLVADTGNNRILLLNTSSRDARLLSLPVDSQLSRPRCMYLEQSRGRLFVGEYSGRVLVIDNIDLK